ncbi:hypothetical protein NQD34_008636 [Periophthalmus magnuspinnatus]|nr:hypothetical protein NQD34_008636 [Periophthalmus magnuspinnatus]
MSSSTYSLALIYIIVQIFQRHNHYPPILQFSSRILLVPYKELRHHRTPSQCIGNNYSPRAQDLNIAKLKQKKCRLRPTRTSILLFLFIHKTSVLPYFARFHGSVTPLPPLSKKAPRSRSISPKEQRDIMIHQEKKNNNLDPTDKDLKRYEYYINTVPCAMLPPEPAHQMDNILSLLPPLSVGEKHNLKVQLLRASLEEEVKNNYIFALKKCIVDYILMEPSEHQRLSIGCIPQPFPQRVVRAPVPWARSYSLAKEWHQQHLFTVSQLMFQLQDVWISSFSSLRFVHLEDLFSANLPLLPSEFEELIQKQCQRTREDLLKRWLPQCVSLCRAFEELWLPLVMSKEEQASSLFSVELFNCVATLMSLQLRSLVISSLEGLLYFFNIHKEGNDFGTSFSELQYTQAQVLVLKLRVHQAHISFEPSFEQCWLYIYRAFMEIIKSAKDIPRVECLLFPYLEELHLGTVHQDEMLVTDIIHKARKVFDKNTVGPLKYLNVYTKYGNLLDGTAKQEVAEFLKEKHSLQGFSKKIENIRLIWREIALMRVTVPLSMFCLYASTLNEDLCHRTNQLKHRIVTFEEDENRDLNNKICQKYQDISDTIRSIPKSTEELMNLNQFIKHTSDVTVHRLIEEIDEAVFRLNFLLDYATLSSEDIRLNSSVFQWPTEIQTELELSKNHLSDMKDQAEDNLHTRFMHTAHKY